MILTALRIIMLIDILLIDIIMLINICQLAPFNTANW